MAENAARIYYHCESPNCNMGTDLQCICACENCMGAKGGVRAMKSPPVFAAKPPSEMFEDAARAGMGTIHADCEFCGRSFIASRDAGDYDDGEYESFLEKAKAEPDRFQVWDGYDSITLVKIEGKMGVMGCPCNKLRLYEDWIWLNRGVIFKYLGERTKEKLEDALEDRRRFKKMAMNRNILL